jgi:hypothetical protein
MNKILRQLDLLRELAQFGAIDVTTRLTIRKLLEDEIQKHEGSLEELPEDLAKFGKEYKMRSERFKEKLERGELKEAVEFVDWASFYQVFGGGKSKLGITPILGKIRANQTKEQLDFLLELAKAGAADGRMELTLKKLIEHYIQECERNMVELSQDLTDFEKKYGMDSEYFYDEFENGKLGDAMDFFEWASLYDIFRDSEALKNELEKGLSDDK